MDKAKASIEEARLKDTLMMIHSILSNQEITFYGHWIKECVSWTKVIKEKV